MTQPTDVRELIAKILERIEGYRGDPHKRQAEAIYNEVVESLLSDIERLEEALQDARHYIANCWIDQVAADEEKALVTKIDDALNRSTDKVPSVEQTHLPHG